MAGPGLDSWTHTLVPCCMQPARMQPDLRCDLPCCVQSQMLAADKLFDGKGNMGKKLAGVVLKVGGSLQAA